MLAQAKTNSPTVADLADAQALQFVGDECQTLSALSDTPLTDEAREQAIKRAGSLMEAKYAQWEALDDIEAFNVARTAQNLMAKLIRGRSPAQIARMEAQRGLCGR